MFLAPNPEYLTVIEARNLITEKTGKVVPKSWLIRYAAEGKISLFAILRRAYLLEFDDPSEVEGAQLKQGDYLPVPQYVARQFVADHESPVRLQVYPTDRGPRRVRGFSGGEPASLEINFEDLHVQASDVVAMLEPIETNEESHGASRLNDLLPKERTSAYALILGMAVHHYNYDPTDAKSSAPGKIFKTLERLGFADRIKQQSVSKWLKKAADALEYKQ